MIFQRTSNRNDGRRRSRSNSPITTPPDDEEDDDEDEEEAFLGSSRSRSEVRTRKDLLLLLLRDARIRSCSVLPSCCCSFRSSRLRCCLQCGLCLVVAASLLGNFAYRYAEQLAGDKPLRWRVDVHPEFRAFPQGDEDAWLRSSSSSSSNIGKSCIYRRGRWHCQDCGNDRKCRELHPRGRCQPFRRDEWDGVPRSVSQYDPNHAGEVDFRTLSALGRYHYYSQPQCTLDSSSTCFDLDKCLDSSTNNNFTLTVYVNATTAAGQEQRQPPPHHALVDYAVQQVPALRRVDHYEDACLSVTFSDTYPTLPAMQEAAHWRLTAGRNNLIYDLSRFTFNHTMKRLSSDAPISLFHVGYAAVASESLTSAIVRPGYDMVLPLERHWGRPTATVEDLHRPRRWLLTFRGTVKDRPQPYYQHRWLAAEYWEEADDVLVDVRCTHSTFLGAFRKTYKDYEYKSSSPTNIYDDIMWNSTFGFCPGGSGVGTYRFGEVLSTGGIPVVANDLVLPLSPEMDWTKCAVRVAEARIVDLPAILRRISPEEIRERQRNCWRLLRTVLGDAESSPGGLWKSQYRVTFAKAMEIWAARIAAALELRDRLRRINQ